MKPIPADEKIQLTAARCPVRRETKAPSSPSSMFICVKSAAPTPTMMMEIGWRERRTKLVPEVHTKIKTDSSTILQWKVDTE
jgi:hypothetical protein